MVRRIFGATSLRRSRGAGRCKEEQEVQPEPVEQPWLPTQAEKDAVQLAHNNMGHPKLHDFARLLTTRWL